MKINLLKKYAGVGLAALALGIAGAAFAQPIYLTINTFDSAAAGTGHEWGPGTQAWDGTQGNPAGALEVTVDFSSSSDTPCTTYICLNGGNPWYVATPINFSLYQSLQFDIKWDNASDITIDQFNDLSTWPLTLTNSSGQTVLQPWGPGYLSGSTAGLDIELCGGPGGQMAPSIATTNLPAAASNGWTHITIPINQAQAQIDGVSGIVFHKWIHQQWGIANDAVARFWIDNVMLQGTAAAAPPPTMSAPTKATPGLNVFASTAGLYDRQEAVLRQTSGLSWVGQATAAKPVTYSFTIDGYPTSVNCEAYLFLLPNPAYMDGAPDWNETNAAIAFLQGNATSATMHFQYKVNETSQQAMYSGGNEARGYYTNAPGSWDGVTPNYLESGNLGSVTNNGILGTWTIKFTSDTNVTLIAPNGNTTNFIFPPYNVSYFAESQTPGFYLYLGMQANNADALNQAVVYSNIAISNTASPYSENFLADSVLDTTSTWNTSAASGPKGVLIVPAGSSYWIPWTLPANGFVLTDRDSLDTNVFWNNVATYPPIPMVGFDQQLISTNDLTGTNAEFFELVKRNFTNLLVLLPGETNAPNTATGRTGTPTPVSFGAGGECDFTVLAVDAHWNPVPGYNDTIAITTTDTGPTGAILPGPTPMVNGVAQFTAANANGALYFQDEGAFTITATDTSNTGIPANTSSSVTVGP
jgi:hypothetical protein